MSSNSVAQPFGYAACSVLDVEDQMKRIAIAGLVALSLCAVEAPASAHAYRYRVRTRRTVIVHRYVPARRVVVVREVVPAPPPSPRLSLTRFVPLPVPRRASVPPPFVPWHPF